MRKSQFIALVILLVVVAGLIGVGAFRPDPTEPVNGTTTPGFVLNVTPSAGTPTPESSPTVAPTLTPTPTPGKVVFPTVDYDSVENVSNTGMLWEYKVASTENQVRTFTQSDALKKALEGRKYIFTKERKEGQPTLYITFNGGYTLDYVEDILAVLKAKDVKVAFFLSYDLLADEANKDLILKIHQDGHLIGSRGTLEDMTKLSAEKFVEKLMSMETLYQGLFGDTKRMLYFRPFGNLSARNMALANQLGYTVTYWSFNYYDYDDSIQNSVALDTITSNFHDGEVMQLSISKVNAAVLLDMIEEAEEQGFVFRRLDQN